MTIRFEWDEVKNQSNQRKHGLSFEIASQVFRDCLQVSVQERIEKGEYRWQTLGRVGGCLLVLVVHTVYEEDSMEVVRIISARKATPKEKQHYEQENDSLHF